MNAPCIEFIKTDDVKDEEWCDTNIELKKTNALDIRANHTKCAEVFAMPQNSFLLICSVCDDLYESMLDFGMHFREKHGMSDENPVDIACLRGEVSCKEHEVWPDGDCLESVLTASVVSPLRNETLEDCLTETGATYKSDDDFFPDDSNSIEDDSGEGSGSDFEVEEKSRTQSSKAADPKLFCKQCNRQYKNPTTFERHIKNLHDKKRKEQPVDVVCRYCDKQFSSEEELKEHKSTHNRFRPYQCPQCPKAFTSSNHRQKHINMHLGYRPYKCTSCPSAFGTECNLRQHMLTHAMAGPLSCEICGKQFIHQSRKDVHMRSHTGEKPFQCELCGRKFIIRSRLTEHMKRHNNTRDHECEVCGKKFYTNVMLRHHQVSHSSDRPFVCSDCGKTFPRKLSLKMHRKIHSDVKQYACNICGREFKQYAGLYAHRKSHGEKKGLPQTNIAVSDKYTPPTHLLVVKNDDSSTGDS